MLRFKFRVPTNKSNIRKSDELGKTFFINYLCCPRRCAYTILEVFTLLLSTVLHGNFYRFYGFCHENKV